MLTAPELLTLIKAHNILSKIKVPAKARKDAGALEKLINEANYKVDHDKKAIKPLVKRGKSITLKSAEELTKPKVAPEVSKAKREAKKAEKEVEKQKELKLAKKEAVKEFKTKQKEGKKKAPRLKAPKEISIDNNKEDMKETAFIKQQKKLQLQKQKETRRALLNQKVPVDKTTRRGKPVKKEEPVKKGSKDFKIMIKGRGYSREEFIKWVDNEGYKLSKLQLDKLDNLVKEWGLQSFRIYYNSNGVLVLVPTLKFKAVDKESKKSLGLVVSEMSSDKRGGSIFKLELKPKVKLDLTPEKVKEYDMTRLKFMQEEIPSLEKVRKVQLDILRGFDKERMEITKREDNDDKGLWDSISYGIPDDRYGYQQIKDDLDTRSKGWKTKLKDGVQYYTPQGVRDWFEKNNVEIQRINSVIVNLYKTITGLQNTEKKIKKKYDIK